VPHASPQRDEEHRAQLANRRDDGTSVLIGLRYDQRRRTRSTFELELARDFGLRLDARAQRLDLGCRDAPFDLARRHPFGTGRQRAFPRVHRVNRLAARIEVAHRDTFELACPVHEFVRAAANGLMAARVSACNEQQRCDDELHSRMTSVARADCAH